MIVLDTHVVVWAYLQPERLSARAVEAIASAPSFGISTITQWEIAMMTRKNPALLRFPVPTAEWLERLTKQEKVRFFPISPTIAMKSVDLSMHKDPADRIIAATAIVNDCSLVTADGKITEAGLVPVIW